MALNPLAVVLLTIGVLFLGVMGYRIFKERVKTVILFLLFFIVLAVLIKLYLPSLF